MWRQYRLRDEIPVRGGHFALGWFVVYAQSRAAAEVTARIHLCANAHALGLLP